MALQVKIGRDWVDYTAGTTIIPATECARKVLHFRDLALVVATAETAEILLPCPARVLLHGIEGANGTVTAGTGRCHWKAEDASYAASAEPLPNDTTATNDKSSPHTTAGSNKFGRVEYPPLRHIIRYTGLAGSATTIEQRMEYHLY